MQPNLNTKLTHFGPLLKIKYKQTIRVNSSFYYYPQTPRTNEMRESEVLKYRFALL